MRDKQLEKLVLEAEEQAAQAAPPVKNTLNRAAQHLRRLDQLVAEMDDLRTFCMDTDEDDDPRHVWVEGETMRGVCWRCKECGNRREDEPR